MSTSEVLVERQSFAFDLIQNLPPFANPVLWNVGVCFSFDFVAKAFFG